MSQPKPIQTTRKSYQAPEVTRYGTLRDLTHGSAQPNADVGKPGSQA